MSSRFVCLALALSPFPWWPCRLSLLLNLLKYCHLPFLKGVIFSLSLENKIKGKCVHCTNQYLQRHSFLLLPYSLPLPLSLHLPPSALLFPSPTSALVEAMNLLNADPAISDPHCLKCFTGFSPPLLNSSQRTIPLNPIEILKIL